MTNGTFLSTDGITQIKSYWYAPEAPKAVVRICHGMSEHIGREGYDAFARFLKSKGYAMCAHDYIGHGGAAAPEDRGYFGKENGWRFLLGDVKKLGDQVRDRFPGVPHILFGHSMGSLVAREYIVEYPDEISRAVIMGTLGPLPAAPIAKGLTAMIKLFKGGRGYSKLLYSMSFGSYLKRIDSPVSKNDWLTRDAEVVAAYDADPLCGFPFTNAAMLDLITIYGKVSAKDWAGRLRKEMPMLFLSGAEDPCGGWSKGVKVIYERAKAAGADARLKLYEGARHELLNELCKQEVYEDILSFIEE